jgi:two-component system, LuxR family, sensor kinase FixL
MRRMERVAEARLPGLAPARLPPWPAGISDLRLAQVGVTVFAGYYLGAKLGLALTFHPNPVSVLWPPNAILFAALLLVPPTAWWVVIAAALPAHLFAELQDGIPASMVMCWFVSNVTEAAIGAGIARVLARGPFAFETPRHVVVFLAAAIVAALSSSFLDAAFVELNRWGEKGYWEVWSVRTWSNATASLIIVPAAVTWARIDLASATSAERRDLLEAMLLAAALLAATIFVFDTRIAASYSSAQIYLPLPFLLWAAYRFGPVGCSTSTLVVALVAIWGTARGVGALGTRSPEENAHAVQLFLMFTAPTLLCLAAAMQERRRGEESLRSSDQRFQVVLHATRDTVYDREMAGGAMWWSGNGLAQFGYRIEERQESFAAWLALVHPEDRDRMLEQQVRAMDTAEPLWQAEFRVRRADGTYADVHEQGYIVRDSHGTAQQMIGALTDVTERRDSDDLSHRLAHAARLTAVGELAASIAHDINQPISAILSNVDAAEMLLDASVGDHEELRQILADIRSDDLRASEVIRHIRGLANKRETEFEAFDVNHLVSAVLRLVTPIARRRGMAVTAHCGELPLVRGDRIHVQQVLLNLLFNGMDAMNAAPKEMRALHVSTAACGKERIEISVADHGHGIASGHFEKIFESFFTTKREGMGLGLSIARSLVQAHGGRIWAENNPAGGATFRFTLPAVSRAGDRG